MKRLTALLLLLALLLPACAAATDGADDPSDPSNSTGGTTVKTTTADWTVPTETLPTTVPSTGEPTTTPVATVTPETTTNTPEVTTSPVTTAPITTSPVTTDKPVTDAPHTHSYSAWTVVKAATCTADGREERTCDCGEKESRNIAAIGHSFGDWKVTKAATCGETGGVKRTCACGESESRTIAATGRHSWLAWNVTKKATYTAEGQETRTCSGCDNTETRSIDKLAAVIDVPATPTLNNLFPIDNAARVTLVSSTAGGFGNETTENLFDSAPYTKLCTNNTDYTIVWKLDQSSRILAYSLQTANDTERYDRRPTAWTLEASSDGVNWKTVSTVNSGNLPQQNYAEKLYAVEAGNYEYFRFTLKSPDGMTQMSEITLYTNEIPMTPALESMIDSDRLDDSANMVAGLDYIKLIIDDYYHRDTHIVSEQPGGNRSTTLWPATSFLEAVAEAYRACPDDPYIYSTYVDLLNNCLPAHYRVEATITSTTGNYDVVYYNAVANSTGDYYYDDDAWVCIQFLIAYDLLGDERYLELAEESLEFFWTGWDDKLGGGIYWDKSYQSKNTCADGPIAIAFLRAYEITGKDEYLEKGKMIYEWLRDVMLENDLYCDAISMDGTMNRWKAAYNQGTPLAVGALLYRITGEQRYLTETTAVWRATINHMFRGSGSNVTMNGNPIYRAWCVGWLVRGLEMYYMVDDAKKTEAMDKMLSVLEDERGTIGYQGREGYYDPYFLTGDWATESMTQILQTAGVACTFLLAGHYELSLN